MSRSSVCLQDFRLGLVNPRQRNSHSWINLGMLMSFSSVTAFSIHVPNLLRRSEYSQIQQDFPAIQTSAQVIQPGRILHPCFVRSCVVASKVIPDNGKRRDRWENLIPGCPKNCWDLRAASSHGRGGCSSGEDAEEVKGRLGDELFQNKEKCGGGNSKSKDTPEFSGAASRPAWSGGVVPALGRAWTRWTLKVHSKPNIQGF